MIVPVSKKLGRWNQWERRESPAQSLSRLLSRNERSGSSKLSRPGKGDSFSHFLSPAMSRLAHLFLILAFSCGFAHAVRINEFLADNTSTSLEDEDGDTPDWIELHNPEGVTVDLEGWYLTDDPGDLTKWRIPAVSIEGNGYLVVFASQKDRAPAGGSPLHTNFVLAQAGEYLALVEPDGVTVVSEFGPEGSDYPNQRAGVSYGYFGDPERVGFMFNPTPGEANDDSTAVLGFVADTEFDIDRGFFDEPFEVAITSATPGASIRYTTDGSWPTERTGELYTGPVPIDRTLPLKAIAFKNGFVSSNVDTQTYIFVGTVVRQSNSTTQSLYGFPSSWNGQPPYYGMNNNPSINPGRHRTIKEDLKEVPTLSIAMETDDLFGSQGIYSNPQSSGINWERKTSLEFIDPAHPDGSNNFQHNCAIRIQGGAFRSFGLTRKKSFRVLFKSEWGPSGLPTGGPGKLDFPLFGPDAARGFQTLTFRMESNDGWQWGGASGQPQYARDEFGRRAQLALGQPASHGRYCHIYLNGVYWGVYNVVERPDSGFAESYLGATRETWQGQNSGNPINDATDTRDWNLMLGAVDDISAAGNDEERDRKFLQAAGFNTDGSRNNAVRTWIDPVNFVDYLLVNWYGGNSDWPHKNFYCGRSRDRDSSGFKFFMWDSEWSLFMRSDIWTDRTTNFSGVAAPQQHLSRSPEYRALFGDRTHRALFNDGVFTPEKATALYEEITAQHRSILNPEAARWGNQHGGSYSVSNWESEYDRLVNPTSGWFAKRPENFLNQLRTQNLYPDLEAPTYSQHGGSVPVGSGPTLSVPDNITRIYYMFGPGDADPTNYRHSLDPRLVGGGINPDATLIEFDEAGSGRRDHRSDPLSLTEPGFLLSRSYDSRTREWSALNVALFTIDTVPADASNLVVSEIHYHPAAPSDAEIAEGYLDQDLFEFIEVQNISDSNVDLTGVDFIAGVAFEFAPGFTLASGEHAVIVKDPAAFAFRYPEVPASRIAGVFLNQTGLSNSGETVTLRGADEALIKSFAYDDAEPWPMGPDGLTGESLVLANPLGNPDHSVAGNWRGSGVVGGTPGRGEDSGGFVGDPQADRDGDGKSAYLEYAAGTSDEDPADGPVVWLAVQSIEVGGVSDDYFTVSFGRDLQAGDVEVIPQVSTNLVDWNAGEVALEFVSQVPSDGTRLLVTYRVSVPRAAHEQLFVRLLVQGR